MGWVPDSLHEVNQVWCLRGGLGGRFQGDGGGGPCTCRLISKERTSCSELYYSQVRGIVQYRSMRSALHFHTISVRSEAPAAERHTERYRYFFCFECLVKYIWCDTPVRRINSTGALDGLACPNARTATSQVFRKRPDKLSLLGRMGIRVSYSARRARTSDDLVATTRGVQRCNCACDAWHAKSNLLRTKHFALSGGSCPAHMLHIVGIPFVSYETVRFLTMLQYTALIRHGIVVSGSVRIPSDSQALWVKKELPQPQS